jgi:hypothetical protein
MLQIAEENADLKFRMKQLEGKNDGNIDNGKRLLELAQKAARLHRLHAGKVEVQVYGYVDSSVPMLAKMHDKRMKGFRAMGYEQAI